MSLPLRTPSTPTLDALFDALDYNPETGELVWLKSSRRIPAGSAAGFYNTDGKLLVGFQGAQYQGSHLAWFFLTDEWPSSKVQFKNGDCTDLRADNLQLLAESEAPTRAAQYMRAYREKRKERPYDNVKPKKGAAPKHPKSKLSNVFYSTLDHANPLWWVRDPDDHRLSLASFKKQSEAEHFANTLNEGRAFIRANPPIKEPGDETVHAGSAATLTLAEASEFFAYDPDKGVIYRRTGRFRGALATTINDRRQTIVAVKRRVYQAGMLAWFLETGQWPKRKQLGYRDGKSKNLAFSNLFLKGAPYASNVEVTDPELAWEQSRARAALRKDNAE